MKLAKAEHNIDYGLARASKAFTNLLRTINGLIERTGGVDQVTSGKLPSYTVATLPDATLYPLTMIYVSDESGGATPAFSDGTNWRRTSDRAIVS